jgi:hypothetical protein
MATRFRRAGSHGSTSAKMADATISQVVCIAMLNAETQRGQTFIVAEDFEDGQTEDRTKPRR